MELDIESRFQWEIDIGGSADGGEPRCRDGGNPPDLANDPRLGLVPNELTWLHPDPVPD